MEPTDTVRSFLAKIQEGSGVPAGRQKILNGFPPRLLALPADLEQPVSTLSVASGDTLTVSAAAGPAEPRAPAAGPAPAAAAFASSSEPGKLSDGSRMVRRPIADDNSCLFNAVGYVMERSYALAPRLRQVIVAAIRADPFNYNEGILGRPVDAYTQWILEPGAWGRAIELVILAKHFRKRIHACDVRTQRVDVYGAEEGFREAVFVIYDGIHYDAMARSFGAQDFDITVFDGDGPDFAAVLAAAKTLVAHENKNKKFTDTANFTLRCGICKQGLRGEKEAVEHAKLTGHQHFTEY